MSIWKPEPKTPCATLSEGHTFVEVVVALAIVLILSGVLVFSLFSVNKLAYSSRRVLQINRSVLQLTSQFEQVLAQVRPGWWEDSVKVIGLTDGGLVLSSYQGDPEKKLKVTVQDQRLKVEAPDLNLSWGPFEALELKPWQVRQRVVGVTLTVKVDGKEYVYQVPLGAQCL